MGLFALSFLLNLCRRYDDRWMMLQLLGFLRWCENPPFDVWCFGNEAVRSTRVRVRVLGERNFLEVEEELFKADFESHLICRIKPSFGPN
jgi:hypothetical protein